VRNPTGFLGFHTVWLGCGTGCWTERFQGFTRFAKVYRKEGASSAVCVGLCAGQP